MIRDIGREGGRALKKVFIFITIAHWLCWVIADSMIFVVHGKCVSGVSEMNHILQYLRNQTFGILP